MLNYQRVPGELYATSHPDISRHIQTTESRVASTELSENSEDSSSWPRSYRGFTIEISAKNITNFAGLNGTPCLCHNCAILAYIYIYTYIYIYIHTYIYIYMYIYMYIYIYVYIYVYVYIYIYYIIYILYYIHIYIYIYIILYYIIDIISCRSWLFALLGSYKKLPCAVQVVFRKELGRVQPLGGEEDVFKPQPLDFRGNWTTDVETMT